MYDDAKTQNKLVAQVKPKYRSYTLQNFKTLPQFRENFTDEQLFEMEVVGHVLPFKSNNYYVEEIIDWNKAPDDPLFHLTFPSRDMLLPHHYDKMESAIKAGLPKEQIREIANKIRMDLNPHPAGQIDYNIPVLNEEVKLDGMQHKYRETMLFFPKQGQTCHAYCTFCFRWPQFVGLDDLKFATKDIELVIKYLRESPNVSDVLFTGGDPMVMSGKILSNYINALLDANIPTLKTIRIGTKVLSWWPYKFLTDPYADSVLRTFERVRRSGKHLAFMAQFNHTRELQTDAVRHAIDRLMNAGVVIRAQSPLFRHINDSAEVWRDMWREEVRLGVIPYYMFMARDTGAHHYFSVPLHEAWNIFRSAYSQVSGVGRTARGPVMSAAPGKVQLLGVSEIRGEKVFVLRFIQGRNPEWADVPFFAEYDESAHWLNDLRPAFGEEKFFYEDELTEIYREKSELLAKF